MTALSIGGAAHRDLFCGEFRATHRTFEPGDVVWPAIDEPSRRRLAALPFWGEAVGNERGAAHRVRTMADAEPDPVVRDAIALQAYEEARHAALLDAMLGRYGIAVPPGGDETPRGAEWGFLRMGYGECFDSFFAFGLFRIAADTGFFPPALVHVFDGVMQEEARHILFFSNWAAYRQRRLPGFRRPGFLLRRASSVLSQVVARSRLAFALREADPGSDFTMQVPAELGEASLSALARVCLRENDRRLAPYDPRLLRPRMVPALVGFSLRFVPGAHAVA